MGFFDTIKIMKDIVTGGIETYKAGEKLDELIKEVEADYEEELTDDDKALLSKYKDRKDAYKNKRGTDNNKLLEKVEDARIEFLMSVMNNTALPESLHNRIRYAIEKFKKANNKALNSLEETLEKYAETDEQRTQIHEKLGGLKRK